MEYFTYHVNGWLLFLVLFVLQLLAAELGLGIGRRVGPGNDEPTRSQARVMEAAVLGLLALLLGFAFSMAASRFDTRRQQILDEANAIGTTYLRARLLPEPHGATAAGLLRRYADARIDFYDAGVDDGKFKAACDRSESLHDELWSTAVSAGQV